MCQTCSYTTYRPHLLIKFSFMRSTPIGPRRINELRRVTVPTRHTSAIGVTAGSWVLIRNDRRDDTVLVIKAAAEEGLDYHIRDIRRPRRVSDTGQVTLPAALLDRAGIAVGDWVAFMCTRAALRLFSAERVRGPYPLSP